MKVYREQNTPDKYGPGTIIELDGNELAHAIAVYLYALDVVIDGSRTTRVTTSEGDSGLCGGARVYVDPSGRVLVEGELK